MSMLLKCNTLDIYKILLVDNTLFVTANEKPNIDVFFVTKDYYLFNNQETVYKYKEKSLAVFKKTDNCFVEISKDSNDMLQSITDRDIFLIFNLSSDDMVIFDFKENVVKKKFNFNKDISLFFDDNVIVTEGISYTRKNKISNWTLSNLSSLWHYILPEGFKIRGSVQAIDNVLFFIAYKDNHYQLVTGLDIETGKILYQNQYEVTNENNFVVARNLNVKDKLMYGYGHVYQVLNPKSGEIILQKEFRENKELDLLPSINSIYDDKLWFVSRRGEKAKFGAVNLNKSEIDFVQDFPLKNDGQLDKPIFHQGKLYLHDSNNVLYVFE